MTNARRVAGIDCDVLIVGLGPVGAVAAGLLGQQGVKVIGVDRAADVYPLPRAAHFDHEIMRVFQTLGVAEAVAAHTQVAGAYEFRSADNRLLMAARTGLEQSSSGWAHAYMFNQPPVERVLRARLEMLPGVNVRLGWSFVALHQDADGVDVSLDDSGGERHTVRALFVLGCDGAWSPVRAALGSALEDFQFDEPWLVIDTIPKDPAAMPEVNLQICDPARPTTCVKMGPGRHRWEFMLLPDETAEEVLADGFVERLLDKWNVDVAIERKAVYRFHGLVAACWREGRVLIAGDAAHQMPPFAGQGMCSGIRDAANLSWKLVEVLKRGTSPDLLDSYQAEREPNVRDYIRLAIDMGRVVCALDPAVAAARDRGMIAARERGEEPIASVAIPMGLDGAVVRGSDAAGTIFPQFLSADAEDRPEMLDDAAGDDAWLIEVAPVRVRARRSGLRHLSTDGERLAPFREQIEEWLAARSARAVLVRPDRYVFGTGDPDALLRSWRLALGAPAHTATEDMVA